MALPAVSVCLTTYNRAGALSATVESILAQSMGDLELIISDDQSKDATQEVANSFVARDKRVKYYRNATNLKMPGNLNAAISRASAPLIANLHDGDIYRPDLLAKWQKALVRQPNAAFVFNALEAVTHEGRHMRFHTHAFGPEIGKMELTNFMLTQLTSPVWGTVMARRECYLKSGPFNARFGFISDVEMWMRLNIDYPVAYIAEPLIQVAPRESSHPYAYLHWGLEQISVDIHRTIIERLERENLVSPRSADIRLRRLREKRWLFMAASCLKNRRWALLREGLELFSRDESLLLRFAGKLGGALVTHPG